MGTNVNVYFNREADNLQIEKVNKMIKKDTLIKNPEVPLGFNAWLSFVYLGAEYCPSSLLSNTESIKVNLKPMNENFATHSSCTFDAPER